jgi:signal peptidase I
MDGDPYDRDDDPFGRYRPLRDLDAKGGHQSPRRSHDESASDDDGGNWGAPPDDDRFGEDDDEEPGSWRERARRARHNMPLWQEVPLLLVIAFCLAVLIRTFLLQAFFIPSGSMEETLQVGDRVLVNKIIYNVRQPERGEIVVFSGTENWAPENQPDTNAGFFTKLGRSLGDLVGISQPGEKDFIKRVVGLPGDTVACCDVNGRVTVNGYALDEPYVTDDSPRDAPPNPRECRSRRFGPITVEPGQMFVMGDHRLVSQDSRCQGQVPIDNVIGRAFVIVWPSGRWEFLDVPATFSKVPRPFAEAGPRPPASAGSGVVALGSQPGGGSDPGGSGPRGSGRGWSGAAGDSSDPFPSVPAIALVGLITPVRPIAPGSRRIRRPARRTLRR